MEGGEQRMEIIREGRFSDHKNPLRSRMTAYSSIASITKYLPRFNPKETIQKIQLRVLGEVKYVKVLLEFTLPSR